MSLSSRIVRKSFVVFGVVPPASTVLAESARRFASGSQRATTRTSWRLASSLRWLLPMPPQPISATPTRSLAPAARAEAGRVAAATAAADEPRKLRRVGEDMASLLLRFLGIVSRWLFLLRGRDSQPKIAGRDAEVRERGGRGAGEVGRPDARAGDDADGTVAFRARLGGQAQRRRRARLGRGVRWHDLDAGREAFGAEFN